MHAATIVSPDPGLTCKRIQAGCGGNRRSTFAGQTRLPNPVLILIGASVMMSLALGMRQCLFLPPMTHEMGLTTADYTFGIAAQNIAWGVTQAPVGAVADKLGLRPVLLVCAVLVGHDRHNPRGLARSPEPAPGYRWRVLLGWNPGDRTDGHSAGALGLARRRGAVRRAGAGDGTGRVHGGHGRPHAATSTKACQACAKSSVWRCATDASSCCAALFVCGLQLVFLNTHLPNYLALCGQDPMLSATALAIIGGVNIVGCWIEGWLGGRYPNNILLGLTYLGRSLVQAVYFMIPPTPTTTIMFAAAMGMLWLGVIPLVSGYVAELFGARYMTTILGLSFVILQMGSVMGAWGGGNVLDVFGSYDLAWRVGVLVGIIAGVVQFSFGGPARPTRLRRALATG